jgi:hypothetical protein
MHQAMTGVATERYSPMALREDKSDQNPSGFPIGNHQKMG